MKHYVLTRSAYGPAWDAGANRRRFAVTRAVTARLMAAQTAPDWTWVVLLDERDPLLADRLALYGDSAPHFSPIVWTPPPYPKDRFMVQRIAAADYKAPWRKEIPSDDTVLMTRLDDDDGFAVDGLARFEGVKARGRVALMLPMGVWVFRRQYAIVRHPVNAMHTLVTPPGDRACVYDYSHVKVAATVPVHTVDQAWGWLWVRHVDTISSRGLPHRWGTSAPARITTKVKVAFPVDWDALEKAWR